MDLNILGRAGLVNLTYGVLALASLLVLVHLLSSRSSDIRLSSWPSPAWLYLQTALTLLTKKAAMNPSKSIQTVPKIQVALTQPHAFHSGRYARLVRLAHYGNTAGVVPLMYPNAEAFKLTIQAMLLPGFPFKILGSVLARNTTIMYRPIRVEECLLYRVVIEQGSWRTTAKGDVEVDVLCEARAGADLVWSSITTAIVLNPTRSKVFHKEKAPASAAAPAPPASQDYEVIDTWHLGADVGRKYGMINGDLNPIHLHALTARIFGFRRPIAHAMFLVSRAEASLRSHGIELVYPAKLATEFKRPTLLPAILKCTVQPAPAGGYAAALKPGSGAGINFSVLTEDLAKNVIVGKLSSC